ncbi:MAG: FlxA-like family protein [Betaproteobacteria bacterium]|nr:FlxA-like family protein [Betaproteobacteria bacterium]
MDISSISGSDSLQAVDPSEIFKKWAGKKLHAGSDGGDTVTISEEGRKLAQAQKTVQVSPLLNMDDAETQADDITVDDASDASSEEANFSSALSSSEDQTSETDEIDEKITELTDQLVGIMQSPLPQEERMQQAEPIQQQIDQLEMQLNELNAAEASQT